MLRLCFLPCNLCSYFRKCVPTSILWAMVLMSALFSRTFYNPSQACFACAPFTGKFESWGLSVVFKTFSMLFWVSSTHAQLVSKAKNLYTSCGIPILSSSLSFSPTDWLLGVCPPGSSARMPGLLFSVFYALTPTVCLQKDRKKKKKHNESFAHTLQILFLKREIAPSSEFWMPPQTLLHGFHGASGTGVGPTRGWGSSSLCSFQQFRQKW